MKRRCVQAGTRLGFVLSVVACLWTTTPAAAQRDGATASGPAETLSDPFPGRREVSLQELFGVMAAHVPVLARSAQVRSDFERLFTGAAQRADEGLYLDYVRVRLAFEATRAGGLWGIAWQVTDQLPQSDRIWAQWRALPLRGDNRLPTVTAIAECDELSALFAFTAHGLGLSRASQVGLFWPTSNHTVAVWVVGTGAQARRIVVPTSQIFLDAEQSLGTTGFDPWKQKTIYDYRRTDMAPATPIPASLARQFVQAVRKHSALSQVELQVKRNAAEGRQRAGMSSKSGL